MLILGNISGIQDFLFDVRETGGKQAASLRFRSFRLQVIAECLARKFLWSCGLGEDRLLFCAAGKFGIDAAGVSGMGERVSLAATDAERWLLGHAHGRLRFAVAVGAEEGTMAERYGAAGSILRRAKLRAWAGAATDGDGAGWPGSPLVADSPWDAEAEGKRDAEQGRRLLAADALTLRPALGSKAEQAPADVIAEVATTWHRRSEVNNDDGGVTIDLRRLSRHVPRNSDGQMTEFVDLASQARGAAMLGVLKADADGLGDAMQRTLAGAKDLTPLKALSGRLETFFGSTLEKEMSDQGSRWASIYTVFSGGDDLLLVGPWDVMLDFACHVRRRFFEAFKAERLTISAGVALVKPKFPIRLAAQQAEELLDLAKLHNAPRADSPKDQCATLGALWKWSDHERIIDAGRQLADWVDAGVIQRGWLHTLLELALLRRNELPHGSEARTGRHDPPEMATSRLAYHVTRNWPNANDSDGSKHDARAWIDTVLRHFDTFDRTADPVTLYLPVIVRYAMLATRSPSDKE